MEFLKVQSVQKAGPQQGTCTAVTAPLVFKFILSIEHRILHVHRDPLKVPVTFPHLSIKEAWEQKDIPLSVKYLTLSLQMLSQTC